MSDASCHVTLQMSSSSFTVMPHTLEKYYMPCHVASCKFLTTSNAGLKNHLRTHAPKLRARCYREQAHCECETHENTDNLASDNNWNNPNLNLHELQPCYCSNYRVEIGTVGIKNLEDLANRNSSVTVRTLRREMRVSVSPRIYPVSALCFNSTQHA